MVVAATYGANCGAQRDNVVAHIAQTCNGRPTCSYRIDHGVIGDPARGCSKDYVAEYRCPGVQRIYRASAPPEAGFGSVIELSCANPTGGFGLVTDSPPPPPGDAPPTPPAGAIQVVAGSYGQNCRAARGNKTAHLQQLCNGKPSCAYRIDHQVIGDPAFGCSKDYVAEWRCGTEPAIRQAAAAPEAGLGSIVELRCD